MRIQELEVRTGLDRATIRYYEKEEMITPQRRENGYRDYSEEDAQHLLKIKLLRQLGMSLEKIRALQQGSENMGDVLQEQILMLRAQQKTVQRSLDLCVQLRNDGVSYENMDPAHYLEALTKVSVSSSAAKTTNSPFREQVYLPYHPWRHFLGRMMDMFILFFFGWLLLVLFYRTAAFSALRMVFQLPVVLLLIPVEALCYKLFGTTPGKYLFGIHIYHVDGCKHTFGSGLVRAFDACCRGYGLGIPFIRIWRMWKSLKNHEFGDNGWNRDSEVIYKPYSWRQTVAWILVPVLLLSCVIGTNLQFEIAPNHGRSITVEEFSENFNHYYREKFDNPVTKMDTQGKLVQKSRAEGNVVYIGGRVDPKVPDFVYDTNEGKLTGITCVDAFAYNGFAVVFPKHYKIAMISLLASGEGENGVGVNEFLKEFDAALNKQITGGTYKLVYETENIEVTWEVSGKGKFVIQYNDGFPRIINLGEDGENDVTVRFSVYLKKR